LISLSGITRHFSAHGRDIPALDGIDLDLAAGEFVALTGPSGCGKSTLLGILGLLDTPTSGSYRLDDRELVGESEEELSRLRRGKIGFVFQGFNLLRELTVFENVELPLLATDMPARTRRDRVREILELLDIAQRGTCRPGEISGGQQQRVAIARAVVIDPLLLVADEPTGDLDAASEIEVLDVLRTLSDLGTTIVMATHSPACGSYVSRRLQMIAGRLVA
jgi:putative ABC transport system ATP-binding protein